MQDANDELFGLLDDLPSLTEIDDTLFAGIELQGGRMNSPDKPTLTAGDARCKQETPVEAVGHQQLAMPHPTLDQYSVPVASSASALSAPSVPAMPPVPSLLAASLPVQNQTQKLDMSANLEQNGHATKHFAPAPVGLGPSAPVGMWARRASVPADTGLREVQFSPRVARPNQVAPLPMQQLAAAEFGGPVRDAVSEVVLRVARRRNVFKRKSSSRNSSYTFAGNDGSALSRLLQQADAQAHAEVSAVQSRRHRRMRDALQSYGTHLLQQAEEVLGMIRQLDAEDEPMHISGPSSITNAPLNPPPPTTDLPVYQSP